jgi:uncharacterized protein YqiB (DUF1249 family)
MSKTIYERIYERLEALTFQDTYSYREVYPEPGKIDVHAKHELNSFLARWLKNCLDQDHSFSR